MSKRRRPRLPRIMRARAAYFAGLLLIALGLGLALGPGWGLAAAGVGTVLWSVLLYDVDEDPPVREDGPW
jgi:hypothetical protein